MIMIVMVMRMTIIIIIIDGPDRAIWTNVSGGSKRQEFQ